MESKNIIVDLIHIFDHQNFEEIKRYKKSSNIYLAKKKYSDESYFLIKKGERFINYTQKLIISKSEKSFELIHASIINLSGFSIEKPYLYYKNINNPRNINDIELTDENIQKMFLGIASGLFYLLTKGYYYSNFSEDSIIFDDENSPKLIDFINFDDSHKMLESDLIIKYDEILNTILNKKKAQNSGIIINDELISLINKCKQKTNLPTFIDFITFFLSKSYCSNNNVINRESFKEYLNIFQYTNKIIYNGKISYNNNKPDLSSSLLPSSIEQICFYFYKRKENKLDEEDYFILNSLPEYCIKPMAKFLSPFFSTMIYCYNYENLIEINDDQNSFTKYIELMGKIKEIENKINDILYFKNKRMSFQRNIDKVRIQAIYLLKKSVKELNNTQAKIELAVQYIKGNILPYNLEKALNILDSIVTSDKQTQKLVKQMVEKIKLEKQSEAKILQNLTEKQKEILEEAKNGNVLSLLFLGFAFYTGFNEFPILRSLSIHYYRTAARKSPYSMYLLGYLYFYGIIFPQNFKRAKNCFQRSANDGYIKAEIIDGFFRKHRCRTYLLKFKFDEILKHYLPSFKSMIPNDSLIFPRINYLLEINLENEYLYQINLNKSEVKLHSEKENENCGMFLISEKTEFYQKQEKPFYSKKALLFSEDNEDPNKLSKEDLCKLAKSYFYGNDNYPIDYYIALNFFKQAADKGDSESQWRYALMVENSLGKQRDSNEVERYFQESSLNGNLKGKLLYALFLRENGDYYIFDRLINECCNSGSLDAKYYYAMHQEKIDKSLEESIHYYREAADNGHLDSLIRLIYILKYKSKMELYEKYLNLSASILNESLLIDLIDIYDEKEKYDQSNILIQIGIKINYRLFNSYYADHLLHGKGMEVNAERAKKIALFIYNDNTSKEYLERYIYIILQILIMDYDHKKAALFLLEHISIITMKYRNDFLSFYRKFDQNVAHNFFITVNFCCKEYQECHSILMGFKYVKNNDLLPVYSKINEIAFNEKDNPYAYIILGRILKNGKFIFRNLKKAVQYFEYAAKKNCPEGYYYLGKEYYYGRILDQNFYKAKEYFLIAFENFGEPRAGYYIYKLPNVLKGDNDFDITSLIQSASFGYKRALYKYGLLLITGKDKRISINEKKGKDLMAYAAYQNYKKAVRFCKLHGIQYTEYFKTNKSNNDKQNEFQLSTNENDSLSDFSDGESINRSILKNENTLNQNKEINSDSINSKVEEKSSESKNENIINQNKDIKSDSINSKVEENDTIENSNSDNEDDIDEFHFWF